MPNTKQISISSLLLKLGVAGIMCIILFCCISCEQNQESKKAVPKEIRDSYVAVLPFKNNTGQADLDVLGEMAADWITQGLVETGEGKIISLNRVNEIIANSKGKNIATNQSLSNQAGVNYLIEGSYYKMDSTLIFSTSIKNIESDNIVFAFPLIKGAENKGHELIEELRQRILGYWLTKNLVDFEEKPPVYDAYKAYLEGGKIYYEEPVKAALLFERAITIDTSFHKATIALANTYVKRKQHAKADSIRTFLEQNKSQLSPMELYELKSLESSITRNTNLKWRLLHSKNLPSYGGETDWNWQIIQALIHYFYQPEKAMELLESIDFSKLNYESADVGYLYFWNILTHYQLGNYTRVKEELTKLPFEPSFTHNNGTLLIQLHLLLLTKIEAYDELEERLKHYTKIQPESRHYPEHYLRYLTIQAMFSSDPKTAQLYARKYLLFLEEDNTPAKSERYTYNLNEIKCELYLALGEAEKTTPIIEKETSLNQFRKETQVLKGIYYAQVKNENKAREMIHALEKMGGKYDYGDREYSIAIIEAWLGNKESAISLLTKARELGKATYMYNFKGDWKLKPLFDYPEFISDVPKSFPVPEIAVPVEEKEKSSQYYWIYIISFLTGGLLIYILFRGQRRKLNKRYNMTPPASGAIAVEKEDEFLTRLNDLVEANMSNTSYTMPQLCRTLGISRAQFYRKVKGLTGKSPSVYIRSFRLHKANTLLKTTDLNISEIAYEVGFKDISYFSRSYSEEFGVSPSETRK